MPSTSSHLSSGGRRTGITASMRARREPTSPLAHQVVVWAMATVATCPKATRSRVVAERSRAVRFHILEIDDDSPATNSPPRLLFDCAVHTPYKRSIAFVQAPISIVDLSTHFFPRREYFLDPVQFYQDERDQESDPLRKLSEIFRTAASPYHTLWACWKPSPPNTSRDL